MTLTNVVRTIFYHLSPGHKYPYERRTNDFLTIYVMVKKIVRTAFARVFVTKALRNGQKIVRTTFVRVIVTKPLIARSKSNSIALIANKLSVKRNLLLFQSDIH